MIGGGIKNAFPEWGNHVDDVLRWEKPGIGILALRFKKWNMASYVHYFMDLALDSPKIVFKWSKLKLTGLRHPA